MPVIPMETMSLHKDFEASEMAQNQQQQSLMGSRLLQQPSHVNGSALGLAALPPQTPISMARAPSVLAAPSQLGSMGVPVQQQSHINFNTQSRKMRSVTS